jgi:hypothetical protein
MPAIPEEFFIPLTPAKGVATNAAEFAPAQPFDGAGRARHQPR